MIKYTARGFTLLELFVVISIIAVLTVFLLSQYRAYIRRQQVVEAQQLLVTEIAKVKSATRRNSLDYRISWTNGTSGPVTVTRLSSSVGTSNKVVSEFVMPYSIKLRAIGSTPPTALQFNAPYGRVDTTSMGWTLTSALDSSVTAQVRVVGVTGKVVKVEKY